MHRAKCALLLALLLALPAVALADSDRQRATLAGLRGVQVLIESLDPDAERDGLSKTQLQADVELKLRLAGIKVLIQEQSFRTPGSPCLYVSVQAIELVPMYAVRVEVSLRQNILLERNPSIMALGVATWETKGLAKFTGRIMDQETRKDVADKVDQFINAYLSVNPK